MKEWRYSQNMYFIEDSDKKRVFFNKGEGAYLYDDRGKSYIDFWNGFGSVILGYNDPDVISSLNEMFTEKTYSIQAPTKYLLELSELLLEDYKGKDSVAMFPGGSDATKAAALTAQMYTGKDIIISAGYHGWDPMWSMGNKPFEPNKYGVIDFFFIMEKFEELIKEYSGRIAAVIISPDRSYFKDEYYKNIYAICKRNGLLTIVDDVKCGYRYNIGSSLSFDTFQADMYLVSKGIANGARISCVIGNALIMKHISDFCFTSFYDVLCLVSSISTLKKSKKLHIHQRIREVGDHFINEAGSMIKSVGLPIDIYGNGNLFQFVLGDENFSNAFYTECVEQGLILYEGDNQCISYAFNDEVLRDALRRFGNVLETLRKKCSGQIGKHNLKEHIYTAAYNQTDGCMEDMTLEEKLEFVKSLYKG
jgi:neamine transaminase/2'-deamino-2'-hydroxyneamine transaminase/neomycin C transaminase